MIDELRRLEEQIRGCKRCPLHETRTNAVPGEGSYTPKVFFIGEAPGRNEDLQGRPFVGAAGKLLDELLTSIGLTRSDVYITNLVKCRPPGNRDPSEGEIRACSPYLLKQIELIDPSIIVTLGRHSTKFILGLMGRKFKSIMAIRGRIFRGKLVDRERTIMPTLHPAAALYNPNLRSLLQDDFLKLRNLIKRSSQGLESYL